MLLHHGRLSLSGHEGVRLLGGSRLHHICLGLHRGLLRLGWLLVAIATHHVKEIDICRRRLLGRWLVLALSSLLHHLLGIRSIDVA